MALYLLQVIIIRCKGLRVSLARNERELLVLQYFVQLQEDHKAKELQEIRLSMDSLFSKFCPGKEFKSKYPML